MSMQTDIEDLLGVRARRSDPESSAAAYEAHKSGGKVQRNLDRVLHLIARHPAMTTRELAALAEWDRYEVARRAADLKRLGYATHSSRPRECHAGGRPAVAWVLTERGKSEVRKWAK